MSFPLFTSSIWNLQNILLECRGITGRPDQSMMTDAVMTNIVNFYYQNVLPKELKIFWGYTYYEFFTQPNIDQYPAPPGFQTFNPSVWCDGFPLEWYIDPDTFYQDYPEQTNRTIVGSGDGSTTSFSFAIPAYPILPWSLYVTDGIQVAQDNGAGGFLAPYIGSVDYLTGAVSLTFPNAPALNANITQVSYTYVAARPQGILFYKAAALPNALSGIPITPTPIQPEPSPPNPPVPTTTTTRDLMNMFKLRPVPGLVHKIKMQAIQVPQALYNLTDVPFRADLGPLIALGAALHIFKLFNQMDQYAQYLDEYKRFKDVCMQDTYEEYIYTRSIPTF